MSNLTHIMIKFKGMSNGIVRKCIRQEKIYPLDVD